MVLRPGVRVVATSIRLADRIVVAAGSGPSGNGRADHRPRWERLLVVGIAAVTQLGVDRPAALRDAAVRDHGRRAWPLVDVMLLVVIQAAVELATLGGRDGPGATSAEPSAGRSGSARRPGGSTPFVGAASSAILDPAARDTVPAQTAAAALGPDCCWALDVTHRAGCSLPRSSARPLVGPVDAGCVTRARARGGPRRGRSRGAASRPHREGAVRRRARQPPPLGSPAPRRARARPSPSVRCSLSSEAGSSVPAVVVTCFVSLVALERLGLGRISAHPMAL